MSRGLGGADEEKECCGGRSEGFYQAGACCPLGSCGQLHRRQMALAWSGQRASSRCPPASHASTLLLAAAAHPSPLRAPLDSHQVLRVAWSGTLSTWRSCRANNRPQQARSALPPPPTPQQCLRGRLPPLICLRPHTFYMVCLPLLLAGLDPPFLKDDGNPVTVGDAAAIEAAEAKAHGGRVPKGGFASAAQVGWVGF